MKNNPSDRRRSILPRQWSGIQPRFAFMAWMLEAGLSYFRSKRMKFSPLILLLFAACLALSPATSQTFGSPNLVITAYKFLNITTDTTTLVKSGSGILHTLCVNTPAATETITIYDSLTAANTKIGTITLFASTNPCFTYDAAFSTGLTVVTGTAVGDITVSYF